MNFHRTFYFRGQAIPGAELLMGDLPVRLQEEVSYEEMHKIITQVTLSRYYKPSLEKK